MPECSPTNQLNRPSGKESVFAARNIFIAISIRWMLNLLGAGGMQSPPSGQNYEQLVKSFRASRRRKSEGTDNQAIRQ
jgi:hypothetical protein